MKLIDISRLRTEEHTLDVGDMKVNNEWYSIYELEAEPIVEAIPIKWIEQYFQISGVYATSDYFRTAHQVRKMIEDWRKENESSIGN